MFKPGSVNGRCGALQIQWGLETAEGIVYIKNMH